MKKLLPLFISIMLLISACSTSQQATETVEETPTLILSPTFTSTPTLHPDFIALQEKIAKSGERFSLNPEETIQDGENTLTAIRVDEEGMIYIIINEAETEVPFEDLNFDNENGLTTNEYLLNKNGVWETTKLTPEEQLDLDMAEWNLSLEDGYRVGYDANGNIELRDKFGELVYWNGRWKGGASLLSRIKSSGNCEVTDFVPAFTGANYTSETTIDAFHKYTWDVVQEFEASELNEYVGLKQKTKYMAIYLGSKIENCWAIDTETTLEDPSLGGYERGGNLIWRTQDGSLRVLKTFSNQNQK